MSEDISATMRLSVTLILLSTLVTTVLTLTSISYSAFNSWVSTAQAGLNQKSVLVFSDMNAQESLPAAVVYKLISLNEELFWRVVIQYKDGTTTTDIEQLKETGSKRFKINIQHNSDLQHVNQYDILAVEVTY